MNFKYFWKFTKGRSIIFIYSQILTIFFIDFLHWHYWAFTLWFTPVNWIASYFINKIAFDRWAKPEEVYGKLH